MRKLLPISLSIRVSFVSLLFCFVITPTHGISHVKPAIWPSYEISLDGLDQLLGKQATESSLQYDIQMFGSVYRLRLKTSLVTDPNFIATQVEKDGTITTVALDKTHLYRHFTGIVVNCRGAVCSQGRAAMSRFDGGLRGVIKIGGEDILIEPLPETLLAKRMRFSNIHIVRRKTATDKSSAYQSEDSVGHLMDKFVNSLYVKETTRSVHTKSLPNSLGVEVAVFIDRPMVEKLSTVFEDVREQLAVVLGAFNAVNLLYSDSSLGPIKVRQIVKRVIFDKSNSMPQDAKVTEYLSQFCSTYQPEFIKRANITRDWVLSSALTGLDVYADAQDVTRDAAYKNLKRTGRKIFTVAGVSFGGGLCTYQRNCMVSEFVLLFGNTETMAHEAGHVMGMFHDGSRNSCDRTGNKIMSVQRPLSQRSGWSSCSSASLLRFVASGRADCVSKYASG